MVPVVIIVASCVAGTIGATASAKAGVNQSRASAMNENSTKRVEEAAYALDAVRVQCENSLEALGKEKIYVLNRDMTAFLNSFEKIKNVDFQNSLGLEELSKFAQDKIEFAELRQMTNYAASIAGSLGSGAVGGALAALGAYNAAGALATASTGTAIASLHGAAATNATLAWFGGGSLASGGLGVAGGTAVLGGVVAGAAILVMGIILGATAGANLEHAKANAMESDETIQQFCVGIEQCIAIRRRTDMFYTVLAKFDLLFSQMIDRMEKIIINEGTDYRQYSTESKRAIAEVAATAVTIKSIIDTPILTEDGALTDESEEILEDIRT